MFQGIFAFTTSNVDIGTYILISKNKIKTITKNLIEMDDTNFEKYFDVYSPNRNLAMQLLTSDIMESLINFYTEYNLDFEIIIRNNTVYLRFFTGPMFEPISENPIDKQLLFTYFCILEFILDVTKKINSTLNNLET